MKKRPTPKHSWNIQASLARVRANNKPEATFPKFEVTKTQFKFLKSLGLTPKEIRELEKQVSCRICGKERFLVVDHDHETNEFRDMLCNSCNSGLGLFGDDPKTIFKAFLYLRKHKQTA